MHSDASRVLIDDGTIESIEEGLQNVLRERDSLLLQQVQRLLRTSPQIEPEYPAAGELGEKIRFLMNSKHQLDLLCSLVLDPAFDSSLVASASEAEGLTLLHLACLAGKPEVVAKLLESGASPLVSSTGPSVLHCAVVGGSKEVVKLLLSGSEEDAKVALVQPWLPHNQTPLHVAALLGFGDVAAMLLTRARELQLEPALVNVRDVFGATPLFNACFGGSIQAVKLLLQGGARLAKKGQVSLLLTITSADAADDQGSTCLLVATARKFTDVVQLLLAAEPAMAGVANR